MSRTFIVLSLFSLLGCGTTVHVQETADTARPVDCDCEGVALLLVNVVDIGGAPVSPDSANVVQDGAASEPMFCVDNECRHEIYDYTDAPLTFDITVTVATASEAYEIVVDGSAIDVTSGCECKSWADTHDVEWTQP